MLRHSAALVLVALVATFALASPGGTASRVPAPELVGVDARPFSAVVRWRVPEAARVVVEVGTDERYGIWSPTTLARSAGTTATTLVGLEPATAYRFRIVARWRNGVRAETRGALRTDPWPHATNAVAVASTLASRTSGGGTGGSAPISPYTLPPALPPGVTGTPPSGGSGSSAAARLESSTPLLVNGNPIFPRMVWRQCPSYYPTSIGAGINVFLGVSCDAPAEQLSRLAGRALSTVDVNTPDISGPGLIGWHLPDEADVAVGPVAQLPAPTGEGRVTFLTLTDKFATGTAPGPHGKDIYADYFARADVIGFDTYPVEVRCTVDQIDNVYWMQRELVQLTNGKPTFQWIEAGPMEHCRDNEDPTPAIVRAETWLAIAGGATGIGYFPDYWAEDIRTEIRLVNREIAALAPALLGPVGRVSAAADSKVRITARRYNGATYVIAVNTSTSPVKATFAVQGLAGRKLRVFRDGRAVSSYGDIVADTLPGLGVAVYVAPPAGW